jgi:hypothetical protein
MSAPQFNDREIHVLTRGHLIGWGERVEKMILFQNPIEEIEKFIDAWDDRYQEIERHFKTPDDRPKQQFVTEKWFLKGYRKHCVRNCLLLDDLLDIYEKMISGVHWWQIKKEYVRKWISEGNCYFEDIDYRNVELNGIQYTSYEGYQKTRCAGLISFYGRKVQPIAPEWNLPNRAQMLKEIMPV